MNKRTKFVIATILVAAGLLATRYPILQWRIRIIIFALVSWLVSVWAIKDEDFSGVEWITLPILPTTFAVGVSLLFPLLPANFDTLFLWTISYDSSLILTLGLKIILVLSFVIGYYAAILTNNIYNIAALRTIQLLRAAHSVGFILSLLTAINFYLFAASLHLHPMYNLLFISLISFPLITLIFWSVNLEDKIGKRVMLLAMFLSFALGQIGWAMSFWPLPTTVFALSLGASFYVLAGIGQYYLSGRIFGTTIKEFLTVFVIVLLLVIFSASWRG